MAELEELAAYLLGDATQKTIADQNPYYNLQQAPNLVSAKLNQIALQDPNASAGQTLAWGLGTGLVSGLLGGAGDMYQNTLTDRYAQTVRGASDGSNLPPGLFGSAQRAKSLWSVQAGLDRQRVQDALEQDVARKIAEDPASAEDTISALRKAGIWKRPQAVTDGAAALTPETISVEEVQAPIEPQGGPNLASGGDSVIDRYAKNVERLRKSGVGKVQAGALAGREQEGRMRANAGTYKEVQGARDAADKLDLLAQQAQQGIELAGQTGSFQGVRSTLDRALSPVRAESRQRVMGDELLERTSPSTVNANRWPGALSELEMKALLKSGPSPQNLPETNQEIVDGMKLVAQVTRDYADFIEEWRAQNDGDVTGARAAWDKYKKVYPLYKTDGEKTILNRDRPAWQEFFSGDWRSTPVASEKAAKAPAASSSAPVPPAGYELTGRRNANGDYGIRKIR